jgi:hypothetical protein
MNIDNTAIVLKEYLPQYAILKYPRSTAGLEINYLFDHDYKAVYVEARIPLPQDTRGRGICMLELGCGGGMNLFNIVSVLIRCSIRAVGCCVG